MTDDVEETLASLEQRLRALQAELDAEEELEPPPTPRITRREPQAPPPPTAPPPQPRAADPLDRFGAALRDLVTVWEETAAALRGDAAEALVFRGALALEARGDLAGLCALERALHDVPAVSAVTLRAYAGGAGALEVALRDDVALVPELRRSLAFSVLAIEPGRLTIALDPR
jgi:hypothetical protein